MDDNNLIMKFISLREHNSTDGSLYSENCIWNTIFSIKFQEEQMVGKSFVVDIFKSARRHFKNQKKNKAKFKKVMDYLKLR